MLTYNVLFVSSGPGNGMTMTFTKWSTNRDSFPLDTFRGRCEIYVMRRRGKHEIFGCGMRYLKGHYSIKYKN